jgi:hypothetical protein
MIKRKYQLEIARLQMRFASQVIGMVIFTMLIFNLPELIQKYGRILEQWN